MRRASVNNFGFGGSNVHVIIEQAPEAIVNKGKLTNGHQNGELHDSETNANGIIHEEITPLDGATIQGKDSYHIPTDRLLLTLSAADEDAAKCQLASICHYLETFPNATRQDLYQKLIYSLQRRTQLQWRSALTVTGKDDLVQKIVAARIRPARAGKVPKISYVFTGQGAQWYVDFQMNFLLHISPVCRLGMGRELVYAYPIFEEVIARADMVLKGLVCPWSLSGKPFMIYQSPWCFWSSQA